MPTASQRGVRVQTERALEERTHEERQSTAVDVLADSELFFVDKVRLREGTPCAPAQAALGTAGTVFPESLGWPLQGRDDAQAAAAKSGASRQPRRRVLKPLRCDVVAAAAKTARPVVRPPAPKRKAPAKPAAAAGRSGRAAAGAAEPGAPPAPALRDLWAEAPARVTLAEADFAEAAAHAVLAQDPDGRPAPKRRRVASAGACLSRCLELCRAFCGEPAAWLRGEVAAVACCWRAAAPSAVARVAPGSLTARVQARSAPTTGERAPQARGGAVPDRGGGGGRAGLLVQPRPRAAPGRGGGRGGGRGAQGPGPRAGGAAAAAHR